MTLQDEPTQSEGPNGHWGPVGAVIIVVVVTIVVVAILQGDWHRVQVKGEFLPPESRRPMVMAPLPR